MSVSSLNRWLLGQALLWLPVLFATVGLVSVDAFRPALLVGVVVLMLGSFAWLWRALAPAGNVADRATLARFLALAGVLLWVGATGEVTWPIWFVWGVVVASDLVDGWCARRFGGSDAGAVLDMETDQFTTLGLALVVTAFHEAGLWTLLLPGLKYVFVLGMLARRVPAHDPKPKEGDNLRGKRICAAVMTLLLACALPVAPGPLRVAASLTAVLLLAYSFSSDAAFLLRRRRAPSTMH